MVGARDLLRDELRLMPPEAQVSIHMMLPATGEQDATESQHRIIVTAGELLGELPRPVMIPEGGKNVRILPFAGTKLLHTHKEGDRVWIRGEQINGYARCADEPGWLYVAGLE